jgi:diketogulonate reductase-like aldo/keto reductase
MGGSMSPDSSQDSRVIGAIQSAVEMGYSLIDTAEMYGGGHTETLIGEALRGTDRSELLLISKVWHTNLHYQDVFRALEGSLKRLKTDYLDFYLIHWPNESVPLEETFRALNEVLDRGLVRHIGVSNFNLRQLKRAVELSETALATDQVPYSLEDRQYVQNGVLDYSRKREIMLTAYSPIGKGRVLNNPILEKIARDHGASPAQIALRWLIRQEGVIAIPKATSSEHQRDNLGALEIELTGEEVEQLNQAS